MTSYNAESVDSIVRSIFLSIGPMTPLKAPIIIGIFLDLDSTLHTTPHVSCDPDGEDLIYKVQTLQRGLFDCFSAEH